MHRHRFGLLWLGILFWALVPQARAALTIEITEGVEGAVPIAIVPFGWEGAQPSAPGDVAQIIADDLGRSGRFSPLPRKDLLATPHAGSKVNFRNWRVLGAENLVIGMVREQGDGNYEVRFQLFDVYTGGQLAGFSIPAPRAKLRHVAHRISDIIYEKLTGQKGAFSTRIAYVTAVGSGKGKRYRLNVADADGYNELNILDSPQPLMSPAWAPDGRWLAYVSFERGKARIYRQDVVSGARDVLTEYPGINGAPAWSPDGRRLALTLSKDGNPDIYLLNIADRRLLRITRGGGIDTEPAWAPDGKSVLFTSDRGGRPQLYRVPVTAQGAGGRAQRVTFEGESNARGSFSPDGKLLTMIHRDRGVYRVAVMDLASGALQVLSDSSLDESPSFAPNGSMIIYATQVANRGVLAAVSVDGRVHQKFAFQQGDVREPAWSPYTQ